MSVLLDTHALLWALLDPDGLSRPAAEIIANQKTVVFVSAASAWEIATKVRLGRLPQARNLEGVFVEKMHEAGYRILNISAEAGLRGGRLIGEHGDPFDRMIAAQALEHDFAVVSKDRKLDQFGVRRIW